jgi:hypothetical protein
MLDMCKYNRLNTLCTISSPTHWSDDSCALCEAVSWLQQLSYQPTAVQLSAGCNSCSISRQLCSWSAGCNSCPISRQLCSCHLAATAVLLLTWQLSQMSAVEVYSWHLVPHYQPPGCDSCLTWPAVSDLFYSWQTCWRVQWDEYCPVWWPPHSWRLGHSQYQ